MSAAPTPIDESERLAALIALEIVGTERSAEFDIYPVLAKRLFSTPIAAISLVDGERQWFKASVGLDVSETPRDASFCAHAILSPTEALCVPDATKDPRFADNPLVTGDFGLRFYAGAPIVGPSGHALGALCVIDREPREAGAEVLEQLQQLAVGVGGALRLHAAVRELGKLAVTDPLTGLENRAGFDRRLRAALAGRAEGPAPRVGLLFLDLDGFKAINDLFGHPGGDEALREVAHRLRAVTRGRDAVGRFGGDEFCVLVEDVRDPADLHALGARIHAELAQPFFVERQSVPLRTSIGVAVCRAGASDPEALVRKADAALYDAKRAGRGTTRFAAAPKARDVPAPTGRDAMADLMREALLPRAREPFALAVQPIFRCQTGELAGFEGLVRWPRADGGVRQPSEFIPVAEATGLVMRLDRWALDQACGLAAGWPGHLQVSSNLSAANFFAGGLAEDVRATLARHALAPGRLKLEITETVLLCDPVRVRGVVAAMREMGVHVVLDDFGVGHASIGYLRDYAFDGLKVDRSFTAGVEVEPRSRAFVRAIIQMARALGIGATAEGVETEGQLQALRDEGVETVQGYLLGRPMTPEAAASLIRRQPKPQLPRASRERRPSIRNAARFARVSPSSKAAG